MYKQHNSNNHKYWCIRYKCNSFFTTLLHPLALNDLAGICCWIVQPLEEAEGGGALLLPEHCPTSHQGSPLPRGEKPLFQKLLIIMCVFAARKLRLTVRKEKRSSTQFSSSQGLSVGHRQSSVIRLVGSCLSNTHGFFADLLAPHSLCHWIHWGKTPPSLEIRTQ